jgi:hypothetical protein
VLRRAVAYYVAKIAGARVPNCQHRGGVGKGRDGDLLCANPETRSARGRDVRCCFPDTVVRGMRGTGGPAKASDHV